MLRCTAQAEIIIGCHIHEQRERNKAFIEEYGNLIRPDHYCEEQVVRYWALINEWVAELDRACAEHLSQITLRWEDRNKDTVHALAQQALIYNIGLNGWRHNCVTPRLACCEQTMNGHFDAHCAALHPLKELIVFMK